MRSHRLFYLAWISMIIFTLSCADRIKSEKVGFGIDLVNSSNYSSQQVSVEIFKVKNDHFAYVAGETENMEIYSIDQTTGSLAFLERYQVANQWGGVRALTNVNIKNNNFLVLGNKADNSLEVHKILDSGKVFRINAVYDSDTTFIDEIVTIHNIKIKDRNFIYAGGLDKGLSCFEISENGDLHHIQSIKDDDALFIHGVIGMSSLVIDGKNYIITGAFFDGGISCFEIMENGHLKHVSNVKDNNLLFLNGTFPVNTIQLGDQNYVLVGHRHNLHYATENAEQDYHGDGINVFKINGEGQLNLHNTIKDTDKIRLKGSTRIEILKVNEKKAFVFIGSRDDKGIQICTFGEDGLLRPIKTLDLGYAIYNGMTLKKIDNKWYLLIGAYDKNVLEMYAINFTS